MAEPTNTPEGFADRIQREAREESVAIMADLARLKFRADQVGHVLRALKLPFPDGLQALLSGEALAPAEAPPETETEAPPAPPGPPRRPAPPEAPEAEPPADAAPTPAEPVASAQAAPEEPRRGRTYVTTDGVTRTTPVNPGPEAMPEHLRRMPASSGNGPLGPRVKAAEAQLQVFQDIGQNPGTLPPEIGPRIGMTDGNVGRYVRALAEAGLIEKTGVERFKHGAKTGRVGSEWRVKGLTAATLPGGEEAPGRVPPPEAAAASATTQPSAPTGGRPTGAPAAPSACTAEERRQVNAVTAARDWIVDRGDDRPFSPSEFADALGLTPEGGMQLLGLFAERGIVKDLSTPGNLLYVYDKPTEPGRAAERDHQRAKERAAAERHAGQNGGEAVAGTGRATRYSNHPDTQKLCERAKAAGAEVEKSGGDHIIIRNPTTKARVVLASTPSSGGSPDKTKKRLAAIGIHV
jgi:hypothetical protein